MASVDFDDPLPTNSFIRRVIETKGEVTKMDMPYKFIIFIPKETKPIFISNADFPYIVT